jgi:GPH family glycoside/pentoside/hexuronide:cation symporter
MSIVTSTTTTAEPRAAAAHAPAIAARSAAVSADLVTLISYGIGDMAITVGMVLFGLYVLFFYTSVMGIPGIVVGIASASGLAWDALIDPYIGHRSDVARGRFARRHGFMLVGSLATGLSFFMLLAPPRAGTVAIVMWLVVATFLFRTSSALFRIPYLGLGAELSSDYHGRTMVVGVRSFFGLCGTLLAAALSFPLFFPNTVPGVDPKLSYEGYPQLGLAAGALMTITGLVTVAGTWRWYRGVESMAAPGVAGYYSGLRSALASHAFRRVWIALTVFFLAVVINAVMAIHFFTWYVRIADSTLLSRIQLAFYVGALAGVPCWIWAARHREKRQVAVIAIATTAVLMALATLLFGENRPLGTGQALWLVIGHAIAGFTASALWVVPGSMVADVADEDALTHGTRREGLFFGMLNLGEKVAAGFALLVGGALLQYFVQLEPGTTPDAVATGRIGIAYGFVPALLLVGAAIPFLSYPLTRDRVEAIQRQL